jgi:spore coat protein U-like protein
MSRKHTALALPIGLLIASMVAIPAVAATPVTTFGVSVVVQAACNATAMQNYTGSAANAASSVSVNCSNSTQYLVSMNASALLFGRAPSHASVGTASSSSASVSSENAAAQPVVSSREPMTALGTDAVSVTITY